ncbi:head-tail connector protein [Phaeobacter gallaeciensis]|uniref:head-tail connector protein n=1 Tax=Phaeobacter gallaeciensis TaxID=60890 RepID=UPI0003D6B76F|nr:head-tail connector protein [Phaeobacter gallaeciensis]AHD12147.1 Phage gp6-like head-tail connector protein [Phaeobacter gallaeciensis DSM 26640]ATE95331.1 Phage gp6-like head-tail connector protein [Phaeobacter gallaeciensis]
MTLTPLATVKEGVDALSFDFDDGKLERLTAAAEVAISGYLRTDLAAIYPSGLPADLEQAVIELVKALYEDQETCDRDLLTLPDLVRILLAPYRRFI